MLTVVYRVPLAIILAVLFIGFTIFWGSTASLLGIAKLLMPVKKIRRKISQLAGYNVPLWMICCNWLFAIAGVRWDVNIRGDIPKDKTFMVIANHQSNMDIFVLGKALGLKIGSYKFFIKYEMLWIPFLGFPCWAMDFPFMKRPSKEKMAANPNLKGHDIGTTIRCCERLRGNPVAVLNFLEGTRCTTEKQAKQQSPYQHLLKPKAGGIAFALQAMGDQIDYIVDVTIAYPGGAKELWDIFCGKLPLVKAEVELLPTPPHLVGRDYQQDEGFRQDIQTWVGERWQEKDQRIQELLD